MLVLGTLTLDEDPYVSISYEYSQSSNGRIVGGTKKITLTGSIIEDSPSLLIDKSNEIKDWFAQSSNRYISGVTINNQTYDFVVVDNVSIDSEDWVYVVNYSITLVCQIEPNAVLPSNILNVTYADYLTGFDITETLELSADKQNSYYLTANGLKTIENSLTWNINMSVTCRRSDTNSAMQNAYNLLQQILITTPDRQEFNEYKAWTMYLHSRSLDSNPVAGSLSFSCRATLVPDEITIPALINIQSSANHNYISNTHSKNMNLTANGLVPITWTSIIDLSSFCISSKIHNAKSAIATLIDYYKNLDNFAGQDIDPTNPACSIACSLLSTNCYYKPQNISLNHALTDGRSTATIEWSSDNSSCSNGLSIETEITENNIDQSIVEQSNFWVVDPIITNLNCNKARTKSYNINVTSKYSCPQDDVETAAWNQYSAINLGDNWWEIRKTSQQNNNSYSISVDYIEACT